MNANSYNVIIRFCNDNACFEAKVKELPDVAEYADSYEEAYNLAIDTIETTAQVMKGKGRKMPDPLVTDEDDYSGRVTLRLPKSLHATLAKKAEDEGVSLNHLISCALSSYRGFDAGMQDTASGWGSIEKTRPHTKVWKAKKSTVIKLSERRRHSGEEYLGRKVALNS